MVFDAINKSFVLDSDNIEYITPPNVYFPAPGLPYRTIGFTVKHLIDI